MVEFRIFILKKKKIEGKWIKLENDIPTMLQSSFLRISHPNQPKFIKNEETKISWEN